MDKPSPDGAPDNRALSAIEAASLLGVSQRTIRRAIANGALTAVKQSGLYRIERTTFDRYASDAATARRRPPPRVAAFHEPVRFGLGRPHAPLIGRAQELSDLCAALSAPRSSLITLTGPGGVGKTRLALEAAFRVEHAFPDGVHVVGLAPVRDAELVAPAIAQSFGLEGGSSGHAVDRIARVVRDRRILLVLDNLEQVTAAAPSISRLFHLCPHLTVLSTSRAPLRISDEVDYAVSPLALANPLGAGSFDELISADAMQLFAVRAQAVKRDFAVTPENVEAVAAICQSLDGLPLAIELAAARIRVLPPEALLDRLDPRLPLLTGGPRDRPSHQQTVRDTIAWSYDLLSIDDQALFRQLSVFVGGFSLAAAEAVAQTLDVLDGIANLIDQSLIQQTTDALGSTRFAMLETVREYGLELLLATPEESNTRARHAAWMLDYAAEAAEAWIRTDYALWSDRLEVERGNLRAALTWANGDRAGGARHGARHRVQSLLAHARSGLRRSRLVGVRPSRLKGMCRPSCALRRCSFRQIKPQSQAISIWRCGERTRANLWRATSGTRCGWTWCCASERASCFCLERSLRQLPCWRRRWSLGPYTVPRGVPPRISAILAWPYAWPATQSGRCRCWKQDSKWRARSN